MISQDLVVSVLLSCLMDTEYGSEIEELFPDETAELNELAELLTEDNFLELQQDVTLVIKQALDTTIQYLKEGLGKGN